MPVDEGPEIRRWMLQPLVDAGLTPDDIEVLTFRAGWLGVETDRRIVPSSELEALANDQTPEVQKAWVEHLRRVQAVIQWKDSAPGPK